jgi:fermentation-respiration switch protein FrsA (DUF1100 family)
MEKKTETLQVDGLKIAMQAYLPSGFGIFPTLVLCHGLPSGAPPEPGDGGYPALAKTFCHVGFATMIFNFRGAGESEGNLDMAGWTRDLSAVLDRVCYFPQADTNRINVMGFSAGAVVSIFVAANDSRVTAVASCACPSEFRFLPDAGAAQKFVSHLRNIRLFRDPGFPPSLEEWLEGFRAVAAAKWVSRVSPRPLLLIHGDQDDVVPVKQARTLHDRAKEPKELLIIPGAGHRLRHEPRAMDAAMAWLKEVNGLNSSPAEMLSE